MSDHDRPLRVVLADDEEDIRTVGELALAAVGGCEVRCAASGEEALALIAQQRPDVLILDVMMPVLDGPSTLRRLRESEAGQPLPVIFMTASVGRDSQLGYVELGAAGVITKPFDPMSLLEEVRALLSGP